jgi:hypothetical protein
MIYVITNQQSHVLVFQVKFKFLTVVIQRWYSDTAPQQSQNYKWMGLGDQDDQSDKLRLRISESHK